MSKQNWILMENIARMEVRVGDINYGGHMGNDKALVFTGSTGLVAFDYEQRKPVKLPEEFLEKITTARFAGRARWRL